MNARTRFLAGAVLMAVLATGCSDDGDDKPASDSGSPSPSATAVGPPTVTLSKGDPAKGQPGCSDEACAYITATTANFDDDVTCRVEDAYGGTAGFITWTQGPNETKQSPNYYGYPAPSGWVEISCGGVRSPRFDW